MDAGEGEQDDTITPQRLKRMLMEGTSFPSHDEERLQTDPAYRVIDEMLKEEMEPVRLDLAIMKYWDPRFHEDGLAQVFGHLEDCLESREDDHLAKAETFLKRLRAYGKQGMPGRRGQKSPGAILPRVEVLGALLDNWDEWAGKLPTAARLEQCLLPASEGEGSKLSTVEKVIKGVRNRFEGIGIEIK